ncbi:MAG: SPFH domain-containing protein [Candidatus Korarchaeota archaeon]
MPQVIEWVNPGPDDIVWVYPNEDISWGSYVIVQENQAAIFYRDGKAYDVFGPGRHVVTTQNVPLISGLLRIVGVPKGAFKAKVIYISRKQFQGKFGGKTQTSELAPLQFHGEFFYKVEDPKIFVVEVVGNQKAFTTIDVNNYIRSYFVEKCLAEMAKYSLRDVFIQTEATSTKIKVKLKDAFARIGLDLIDMKFAGLDTEPQYRERLFWMQTGGVSGQQLAWQEGMARTVGAMPSGGAAFGAGAMMMPFMMQQGAAFMQPNVAAQQMKQCPNCKAMVPLNTRFCPNCGYKFE